MRPCKPKALNSADISDWKQNATMFSFRLVLNWSSWEILLLQQIFHLCHHSFLLLHRSILSCCRLSFYWHRSMVSIRVIWVPFEIHIYISCTVQYTAHCIITKRLLLLLIKTVFCGWCISTNIFSRNELFDCATLR